MKKLLVLMALMACAFTVTATSVAKADHLSGCGSGWGGGSYGSNSYYAPSYYSGYSYAAPGYTYQYAPVNSFGYGYPTTGFYYGRPGFNVSIGSGYRGYNSGYSNYSSGYGNYSTGGFGGGRSYYHHR